ncbi:beta-N-acetylhexosaminidase [Lysobacter korlensis]|uniref:beta-N-acetylhexosaminidase n=1 Tax=Lysobacter korlensis TaxID=553636 RepID=A0ABV6RNW7_9GAMM
MSNQPAPALIPQPRQLHLFPGTFRFEGESDIRSGIDPQLGAEEYMLTIDGNGVAISGGDDAGVFYARQTLRQLLPPTASGPLDPIDARGVDLPHVHIEDRPEYPWRGFMLDVARHFLPAGFVLKVIDQLATLKLNRLHLHLTDDQGWRLPVPGYPRLTEVGSKRRESIVGYDNQTDDVEYDGTPHEGAYTRAELQHIVRYAAERHITVVPEVDLPGHAQAAIAAYPHLGSGEPTEVRTRWGISSRILNLEDYTLDFVTEVLDEVLDIFPGGYVHIGGDEVPRREWRESATAQQRMSEAGLPDVEQLLGWFVGRVGEHVRAAGRRPVAWDEVVDGGAPKDTLVMAWRGVQHGVNAVRAGYDVVVTPRPPLYFDFRQSESPEEPVSFPEAPTTLADVFRFEPLPDGLGDAQDGDGRVIGTQANLWTEYVPTTESAEYMTFPRLLAFAEVAWRPRLEEGESRDLDGFLERVEQHLPRLHEAGIRYRPLDGDTE